MKYLMMLDFYGFEIYSHFLFKVIFRKGYYRVLEKQIELSPPCSHHSPSFPVRWSKAHRPEAYCVVVLSQQIRTKTIMSIDGNAHDSFITNKEQII